MGVWNSVKEFFSARTKSIKDWFYAKDERGRQRVMIIGIFVSALVLFCFGLIGWAAGRGKKKEKTTELATQEASSENISEEPTSEEPRDPKAYTDTELGQAYPSLFQSDSRWAEDAYGTEKVGTSGSGPTCLAMAILYLTDDTESTPPKVAAFSAEKEYFVAGTGTMGTLFTEGAGNYGLSCEKIDNTEENLKKHLDEGDVLITSISQSPFETSGTDIIVIYGYDSRGFFINDANDPENCGVWEYSQFGGFIRNVFCMSPAEGKKRTRDVKFDPAGIPDKTTGSSSGDTPEGDTTEGETEGDTTETDSTETDTSEEDTVG